MNRRQEFEMDKDVFQEKLRTADMVLVGLGEDFDGNGRLRRYPGYEAGYGMLKQEGVSWLIPAWNEYCLARSGDAEIPEAVRKLRSLLEGKNHFVVSVSTHSAVGQVGRNVMPCGCVSRKQCAGGCGDVLQELTEEDSLGLKEFFQELEAGRLQKERLRLGICPDCGAPLVLNTVYAENYNERGYLDQWKLYLKWLQGTLNHSLLVLELGVGMRFPSVIRWPFEKTAFFNQKAFFCRVNENLYHLTKELAQKGCGISENAVDWLAGL